jgi:hypothetical protein
MEGYDKLGYVALNVSDVAKSRAFYEQQVGLQFSGVGEGGITFLRCSEDHHSVALYCSEKPGLKPVGFEMRSEATLDILTQRLADYAGADSMGCKKGATGGRITVGLLPGHLQYLLDVSRRPNLARIALDQNVAHRFFRDSRKVVSLDADVPKPRRQSQTSYEFSQRSGWIAISLAQSFGDQHLLRWIMRDIPAHYRRQ